MWVFLMSRTVGYRPCAHALGSRDLRKEDGIMSDHKARLVLECVRLATALVWLANTLLNMAFNYLEMPYDAALDRKI
jgi:hypothetical protein